MQFSRETRRKLAGLRRRGKGDEGEPEAASPVQPAETPPHEAAREEGPASARGYESGRDPKRATEAAAGESSQPGVLAGLTRERLKARIKARREASDAHGVRRDGADAPSQGKEPETESLQPQFDGPPVPVEDLFPGEVRETALGVCYVTQPRVASICDWGDAIAQRMGELLGAGARGGLSPPVPAGEAAVAFLDIETAGLSAMPVFLVGILEFRAGSLTVTQILARDLPEEASLLHETARALDGCCAVFTYNGRTFDMPYLNDRSIYHAVDFSPRVEHIDLLPLARKRYRGKFADCKLQTLESCLCGRERTDDIPGEEIPQRYQTFVRTQDARLLETIVRHNQLDLLTLAELVPHCLQGDTD